MNMVIIKDSFFFLVVILLAWPLGLYIYRIMETGKVRGLGFLRPVENVIYKGMGIEETHTMGGKEYALSALLFSLTGFLFLFLLLMSHGFLPLNPQVLP